MIRVILVDDEPFIRVAIKSLFSWEKHGFMIVSEASNGTDALLKLQKEDIDLLITDIKMPIMDGITLIHQVKTKYPNIFCVVLSNYEDFDLTRRAFLAGAVDYLLKGNLNEESFSALIQRLNNNYFKTLPETSADTAVRPAFERKVLALQQLITGNTKTQSADALKKELNLDLPFVICSIRLLHNNPDFENLEHTLNDNEELIRNTVFKIISEISEFKLYYYAISINEYILFIYNQDYTHEFFFKHLGAFYEQLSSNITIYLNKFSVIGTSQLRKEILDIPISYREANTMSDLIFYCRESVQYYFKTTESSTPDAVRQFVLTQIDGIPLWIKEQNWEALRCFFYDLLKLFQDNLYSPTKSKRLITNLEFLIINELSHNYNDQLGTLFDYDNLFDLTMRVFHITKLEQIITNFLSRIREAVTGLYLMDTNYSDIVQQAISCLQKHYRNPEINLTSVAEEISVNPSYLSRIFHKETKRTFNAYLNFLRLNYAKKLLRTTNENLVRISEKCGYNNSKYFINVFKKIEGLSPSAYRSSLESVSFAKTDL